MSVLLIDGESLFSAPVSYCLAAANRTVHLGSSSRFAYVRFSRFRKKFRWWKDESRLLDNVRNFAREERVEIIMACSDPGIRFLSEYRRQLQSVALGAGTPSVESLAATVHQANCAQG